MIIRFWLKHQNTIIDHVWLRWPNEMTLWANSIVKPPCFEFLSNTYICDSHSMIKKSHCEEVKRTQAVSFFFRHLAAIFLPHFFCCLRNSDWNSMCFFQEDEFDLTDFEDYDDNNKEVFAEPVASTEGCVYPIMCKVVYSYQVRIYCRISHTIIIQLWSQPHGLMSLCVQSLQLLQCRYEVCEAANSKYALQIHKCLFCTSNCSHVFIDKVCNANLDKRPGD